ncbi:outer membrane protein assembly factor [Aquimarina sp. AD1]|uniref:POTRA domain-containing protein n=1 Tax=Aquimarina sp. (strain AD1) TaxID=1714848 RepID=UPI000E4A8169|nr:POTRA domain-containing protein [Aquimarina sp. AD1]AXT56872.1 outer membrane protein assembly factor [Aquimarina sp. AD1]RKN29407.1 outer membrane protein assembly factor [Aquimarina sp. AD1]
MRKRLTLVFLTFCFCFLGNAQKRNISEIVIQGNKKTRTAAIIKLNSVREGEVLDSIKIEEDIKRLKRLPSIAHAYYQVHEKENGYQVVYGVEENFTIIPSANLYTTNNDEFAFRVGLYEFNLLGQNVTLGGFYQDDIYSSFGLNIRAPYLFTNKFGLAFNYQNLTTQEPVFLDNGTADYKYNNTSYEVLGLYQFNFRNRIELGVNYFNEDYTYRNGATGPNVPLDFDVNKVLFKLIYEYNNLDYYFQYVSGFRSVANFQYVISTENVLPDFLIGWNDFMYYHRIGKKGNWASRLRVGLATNDDSPFAPFAVDNNLNIRGVGNTIDRGTGVIVLNTEYRHTLYDKDWFVLQSNVFVDGGSWRNPGGDFGDFGDTQNFRVYPGVGLRFIHKRIFNAIFRIDYGYGVTEDATNGFVFGIGQYF